MALPWVAGAMMAGSLLSGLLGGRSRRRRQRRAISHAARVQEHALNVGMGELRAQLGNVDALLRPWIGTGTDALHVRRRFLGLEGPEAELLAARGLEEGPTFRALARQGEEAMLQQAAATGGLRGGNLQGALAQFRPNLLQAVIEQRLAQLGGLSREGQVSASELGDAQLMTGQNLAQMQAALGQVRAGEILARAGVATQPGALIWDTLSSGLGLGAGLLGGGNFNLADFSLSNLLPANANLGGGQDRMQLGALTRALQGFGPQAITPRFNIGRGF